MDYAQCIFSTIQPGGPLVAGLLSARRARPNGRGAAHHAAAVDAIAAMIAEEAHGMVAAGLGGAGRHRLQPGQQPRPHLKRSVAVMAGQRRLAWAGGSLLSSVLDAFNRVRCSMPRRFYCAQT